MSKGKEFQPATARLDVLAVQPGDPGEIPEPGPDVVPTREPEEVPMEPNPPSETPQPDQPNEIPPGQPDELPQPDQPDEVGRIQSAAKQ
ncbi:hypothetical protein ACXYTJ_14380 [Gilvimarinus sp. F26214L]|uniref:hypothetical protein n=1 Tax=Gilvimarinus sp. DZF01 TaxID=3461371 RepID=UPI004045D408